MLVVEPPIMHRKVSPSLDSAELADVLQRGSKTLQELAFLWLIASTGTRISEALSVDAPHRLRSYSVTLDGRSVQVNTAIVRGKTGDREVPVPGHVANMVKEALPWPWGRRDSATKAVKRMFRHAGYDRPRLAAHSLRHTFARLWDGDESLLQGIMGWSSPAMMRVYRPFNLARAAVQAQLHGPTATGRLSTSRQLVMPG